MSTTTSTSKRSADPTAPLDRLETIAPGVHLIGSMGNSFVVETAEGYLQVDAGNSARIAAQNLVRLRELVPVPLRWLVYSHGHLGYNAGLSGAFDQAEEFGWARPTVIAHEGVVSRYRRYQRTAELQARLNARQFRQPMSNFTSMRLTMPDLTYSGQLTLAAADREIVLIAVPGETDDATAVWLPKERILYGGAAVLDHIPNIGTPQRTYRDTLRWADTLDRLAALDPKLVVPEFGDPDSDDPQGRMRLQARALRWLHGAVIERLNRGLTVDEIIHDIDYPAELFEVRAMRESYGHREYIVRDIVRSETGWWDGNPTTLHPATPQLAHAVRAEAIADKQAVLDKAHQLQEAGEFQQALHVIDLLALAPGDDAHVQQARELKRLLCEQRAEQATSYVSRNLYTTEAPEPRK
jgi:alkyl sulfatase BDS1-like metallo-beta-lactamase superfamily hydrolase